MNNSSISQIPQCIRQITHNAPFPTYFCYKVVHCGIWVWCIVGFVQWVNWLTKNLFLVKKSEFLGTKRTWIEKTYTIDMETWFLFTANENAFFFNNSGTRLAQRAETGLFDLVIFTVSLSSIQCNHVGIEECSSDTVHSVFKAFSYKYVILFELGTRMAPGLRGPFQSFV